MSNKKLPINNRILNKCPLPFRYPGGKFYALGILEPFWSKIEHDDYREPFAGGASVFFNKPLVKYNWLNDLDSELITTYQTMSVPTQRQLLTKMLNNEVATKERWREVLNFKPTNPLEIAFQYYYLNRTSFSGKMVSPGWGYREKRSLPPERWYERINPCGDKLAGTEITNLDFSEVIDSPSKGKSVLMFVDPPYFAPPKRKHYRNGFDLQDHIRLRDNLKKTNYKFFLTYDDVPEIREMYSWAKIHELEFVYRVDNSNVQLGTRKIGFELIITNFDLPKQPNLFENND